MPKVKVVSLSVAFVGQKVPVPTRFYQNETFEATDAEAAGLLKDKSVELAPDSAPVSAGEKIHIDPVEKEIQAGNFEAAKGDMKAPAGADKLGTPPVGPAASGRGMATSDGGKVQPIPNTNTK